MPARNNDWQQLLGLAQRAGRVVSGEDTVLRAVRSRKAGAVILSADASARTKKTIGDKCGFYHIPLLTVPDRKLLGKAIGRTERVVAAVTDGGFAERMIEKLGPSIRG